MNDSSVILIALGLALIGGALALSTRRYRRIAKLEREYNEFMRLLAKKRKRQAAEFEEAGRRG